jgi:hypothetical protein
LFEGDPGCPYGGTYSNLSNLAPRLGFAYRLGQNTVLRGGAGMYYIRPQMSQAAWNTTNEPFAEGVGLNVTSFADPYGAVNFPDPFPAYYTAPPPGSNYVFQLPIYAGAIASDFHISALATWNLVLQHQFGQNWQASVMYVGNAGYHLSSNQGEGSQEENPPVYIPGNGPNGQPLSTEANTESRRLNTNFGNEGVYTSTRNSKYNSLELNLERRFSHGLSLVANYTWERAMDDFPPLGDYEATDPFNIRNDWGVSSDNVSNVFHLSEVWRVPHFGLHGAASAFANGWEVTSIVTWLGGFPFSVFSGVDNSFSAIYEDRADFTGQKYSQAMISGQSHGQMVNQYFNPSHFTYNAVGTFGDAGKNVLLGPRSFNTDLAVIKDTSITEHTSVQFRAEFFNIFNNVDFLANSISSSVTNPNFGAITSANNPRIIQFGLKLLF